MLPNASKYGPPYDPSLTEETHTSSATPATFNSLDKQFSVCGTTLAIASTPSPQLIDKLFPSYPAGGVFAAQGVPKSTINLSIQLMALMTDCVADRVCARRTQEILLLLRQLCSQVDACQPLSVSCLDQELEKISETWQHLAHSTPQVAQFSSI